MRRRPASWLNRFIQALFRLERNGTAEAFRCERREVVVR